jgi:hypothetical protein
LTEFHPTPTYHGHVQLESLLDRVCKRHSVAVITVPNHAALSEQEKEVYNENFSNESLYIRSLPDKLVLTKQPFFIDAKSTYRKNTGKISIELSAYYFDLKRVKQGVRVCFLYEEKGEPRVFSPLSYVLPAFIIIQPKWTGRQRELFRSYAASIAEHLGIELDVDLPVYMIKTGGSEDPCVIIPINNLWECSTSLENFVSQMNREGGSF